MLCQASSQISIDKAFLVEQAVRRQEILPVHVKDARGTVAKPHVGDAVVQVVAPLFVEAHHHIQRPSRPIVHRAIGECLVEIAGQRSGRDRDIAHATFDEVAAEHCLGEMQDVRMRRQHSHLGENVAETIEVGAIITLVRVQLGDRNSQ
jgi:hypothetical protein